MDLNQPMKERNDINQLDGSPLFNICLYLRIEWSLCNFNCCLNLLIKSSAFLSTASSSLAVSLVVAGRRKSTSGIFFSLADFTNIVLVCTFSSVHVADLLLVTWLTSICGSISSSYRGIWSGREKDKLMDLTRCSRDEVGSSCELWEGNGSGKQKLKDLTRDGVVVVTVFLWVLRFEVMKIVPIIRFNKQKRIMGVNQLAKHSIMLSTYWRWKS